MVFFKKGKKSGRATRKVARRRLAVPEPSGSPPGYTLGRPLRNGIRLVRGGYKRARQWYTGRRRITKPFAQRNFNSRLQSADNIITAPAFIVGKPRKPSFEEKVSKITHPPVVFKRQYAFNAEGLSGRKSMFGIPINNLNAGVSGGNLYDDVMTTNSARMSTNTSTADPTIIFNNDHRTQQSYYVDYQSCKLRVSNSGSNSCTGKISLLAYKRDCDGVFTNSGVPLAPINMMMFAQSLNANVNYGAGQEATVGNGYMFNSATSGYDYDANYDMPGSALNAGGQCANMDPGLTIFSSQIKDLTGYYFRLVKQHSFSLKPGQQFNISTIFHDLPSIKRQAIDMTYLKGVSHYLVIEFEGQVVGDATVTSGDNVVSLGSAQLSCIYEEKRMVGVHGKLRAQLYMGTNALAVINKASQVIINPDTGVTDTGYEEDT